MTDSAAAAVPLSELARRTGATLEGPGDIVIARVGTLERAGPGDIAFLANPRYRAQLATTRASAEIVAPADAAHTPLPRLVSSNPYAVFAAGAPEPPSPPGLQPGVAPAAPRAPPAAL